MTENQIKTLALTTLDILKLKKLMIVKPFTAWILYICSLIMLADILKEKSGNKYLIFGSTDEKKELLKIWCLKWNQKQNRRSK